MMQLMRKLLLAWKWRVAIAAGVAVVTAGIVVLADYLEWSRAVQAYAEVKREAESRRLSAEAPRNAAEAKSRCNELYGASRNAARSKYDGLNRAIDELYGTIEEAKCRDEARRKYLRDLQEIATHSPSLARQLAQSYDDAEPPPGRYRITRDAEKIVIALFAASVGAFLILTALALFMREQSVGWRRITLLVALFSAAVVLGIGLGTGSHLDEEVLWNSSGLALTTFPVAFLVVLGGKSIAGWVHAGFRADRRRRTDGLHAMDAPSSAQAEQLHGFQRSGVTRTTAPQAFEARDEAVSREEDRGAAPAFNPHAYLTGVDGWLAWLTLCLMVLAPLLTAGRLNMDLGLLAERFPTLHDDPRWGNYTRALWAIWAVATAFGVAAGHRLWKIHEPGSVRFAITALWLIGPLAYFAEVLAGAIAFRAPLAGEVLGGASGACSAAKIWTAYLMRSRRVRNTYRLWLAGW
jgi:hypothetical protein